MDFGLTEQQKGIIALIRDFSKREVVLDYLSKIMEREKPRDRVPEELLRKLDAVGLRTLSVPEKYGGMGINDYLTLFVLGEALGRWFGPLSSVIMAGWVCCKSLNDIGTEEQKDEFFPQFVEDHTMNVGYAATESDAGTDVMLPYDGSENRAKALAYRDGDDYVINGEKSWVSGGAIDRLLCVCVRTCKDRPFSESASVFWVPSETPGVSVERENVLMTPSIRGNAVIVFDNVRVPKRYLVGEENKGWRYENESIFITMMLHVGVSLGYYQAVYEQTKEYAKARYQGGKPLFEHEQIAISIADMHLYIQALRQLCYKTCWEYDQSESTLVNPLGENLCDAFSKEVHLRLADHVAEIWGGVGIMKGALSADFATLAFSMRPRGGSRLMHLLKAAKYI
jgi:hypothetical protein